MFRLPRRRRGRPRCCLRVRWWLLIVDDNGRLRLSNTPAGSLPAKTGLSGEALAGLVV